MVQGSAFANEANQTRRSGFVPTPFDRFFNQDVDATGGDLLARWTHTLASGSQTSLQTYVDSSYRRTDFGVPEVLRTFDVDFQHHAYVGANHDIVWGLAHRVSRSALAPGYALLLHAFPSADQQSFEAASCRTKFTSPIPCG